MSARISLGRSRPGFACVVTCVIAAWLPGCGGSKEPASAPSGAASTTPATPPPATPPAPATAAAPTAQTWTPEALEDLLAPVALYPDPVLSQMLIASTNPQEVLDAGNWLVANEGLKGQALDDAAAKIGFTPPIRALVQFPQVMDMMCMEMGWTTELGQAFTADQAGVLDAVQRLRKQAQDVGNLKSSDAMKVETEQQEGKEVVVLKPPKPDVVYVPQYDPQVVYAPAPAQAAQPAPAAPAAATASTTTTTTTEEKGHSTGSLVATGLLAFGAGILVNEVFDDDDDYYYPHYGYGGMPYYPPYAYRPAYGGGYYPSNGYNRPPNYNSGWQNNGTIIINNPGGGGGGNNYWNRYDNRSPNISGATRQVNSPITAARPNRPELAELNKRAPRPMPADVRRPSETATAANWKGQSTYAGREKRPAGASTDAATRIAQANPKYSKPASGATRTGAAPKVQGSYAGANRNAGEASNRAKPSQRDTQPAKKKAASNASRPATGDRATQAKPPTRDNGDRGYGSAGNQRTPQGMPTSKDVERPNAQSANRGTAMSGADRGASERLASQRGHQSLPQGAHSKRGGGERRQR